MKLIDPVLSVGAAALVHGRRPGLFPSDQRGEENASLLSARAAAGSRSHSSTPAGPRGPRSFLSPFTDLGCPDCGERHAVGDCQPLELKEAKA